MELTWSGPFYEDEEEEGFFLPIYGPVDREGTPLGFLFVFE